MALLAGFHLLQLLIFARRLGRSDARRPWRCFGSFCFTRCYFGFFPAGFDLHQIIRFTGLVQFGENFCRRCSFIDHNAVLCPVNRRGLGMNLNSRDHLACRLGFVELLLGRRFPDLRLRRFCDCCCWRGYHRFGWLPYWRGVAFFALTALALAAPPAAFAPVFTHLLR